MPSWRRWFSYRLRWQYRATALPNAISRSNSYRTFLRLAHDLRPFPASSFSLLKFCLPGGRVLKRIVLCLMLEIAAMKGANLRPEDFEDLLKHGQRVRIESVCREADRDGEDDP